MVARALHVACFASLAIMTIDAAFPDEAQCSGFYNPTQSVGAASVSDAGATAIAEDASTIFYNAAGMALLQQPEGLAAIAAYVLDTTFANKGTASLLGMPVIGPPALISKPHRLQAFSPPCP